jgi:RNA polymerase sigma factor (sigma-70 family)
MTEDELLAERFQEHRPHLRAVAYRMLGSLTEADDALQEAWLRVSRADTIGVENLGGWLTTVVARVSLNVLRARKAKREEPLEARLPDPIVSLQNGADPEHEALVADSVGLALLVVLETLAPAERVAFVLHDMFAVPFGEIASITGRSPVAARQLASRARRRVQSQAPVPDARTSRASASSWTRSSPQPETATSTRSWLSWTRTSCFATTAAHDQARQTCFAARVPWPTRHSPSRASRPTCGPSSSTEPPASSSFSTTACSQ